jgi:hypothetical protein
VSQIKKTRLAFYNIFPERYWGVWWCSVLQPNQKIPKQSALGFLHGYGARLWLLLWSTLNDIVLLKKIKTFSFSLTNTMLFAAPISSSGILLVK